MSDPEIVTVADIRKAGHCVSGARRWFAAYGLDFRTFLKNGISVEEFLGTGDTLAEKVVEAKRKRESDG